MILRFLILLNVLCITFSLTYAHTGKRHVEKQNIDIQESNEESASTFLKKLLSFESVEEENLQEPQIFLQKEEVEPEYEEAAALADSLENESNHSNYASETLDSEPQSALAQSESPISKDKLEPASFLRFENATLPTGRAVRITSPYGIRSYRMHKGIDVKVCKGDSILAAFSGRVVKAAYERRGYGHYIVLEHDNGTRTVYAHLSKRLVKYGEKVYSGQLIGKGGNTGRSTGSHLHFEITYKKMTIDPSLVFDFA
jgi:murein DD-endopeptidase MepM/ murein hydrolase activator NlpD